MEEDEISGLWERYLTASQKGLDPYFDVDEVCALLDSFEMNDDFTNYEPLLHLGLRLHPDSDELKIRQCRLLVHNEEYKLALDMLNHVDEFNDLAIDVIRLECYCALNKYKKVVTYMQKIIRLKHPGTKDVFDYLASVLSEFDMIEEAEDFIEWGLELFPDDADLKSMLCNIYEMDEDFEGAINICTELVDSYPCSYVHWFTLGRLYLLANKYEQSSEAFDFAAACDNSDENLKILKAYALFMNGNYEKALEMYSDWVGCEENEEYEDLAIHIKSMKAECYIKLDEYEKAYHELQEIINMQTEETREPSLYINYIRICLKTDRENEAALVLSKAVAIFPDNIRILSMLALNYLKIGRDDLATQITDKILDQMSSLNEEDEKPGIAALLNENSRMRTFGSLERNAKYYKNILQLNTNLFKDHYILPKDLAQEYLNNKKNNN
jgi:tetratricopeptide (TPR) repeat protein